MESFYDVLNELHVTPDYLYKQHTGHRIFNDGFVSSSESSDGSDDSDSENKPPLFTYEEIMANLGDYNPELSASGDSIQETPETIARKLHQYMTEDHCSICNEYGKNCKKHYTQPSHFKGVMAWIEGQLKQVKQPVDWELIFCLACNQPLTGNEQGRAHYSEFLHKVKASSFCTACLRVIDYHNMVSHCMSKQHKQNEAMRPAAIKSKEELNRDHREATVSRRNSRGPTVQTTFPQNILPGGRSYASALTSVKPKADDTLPVRTQANTVSSKVEPIAKSSRSKKHKKKVVTRPQSAEPSVVERYMEPRLNKMPNDNCDPLGTKYVSDDVFYEGGMYVPADQYRKESFHDNKAVGSNGTRVQYDIESSNYYELLIDRNQTNTSSEVDNYSSLNQNVESIETEEETTLNNEEVNVDGVKKRRKRRKRKTSRYSEDVSSVTDEVSKTFSLKEAGSGTESAEIYCKTPRNDRESIKKIKDPVTLKAVHAAMFRVLFGLMRWNYCNICNEPVSRQVKGNHYKQKFHITNFTQFIETEGLHYGYSMLNIGAVYCLFCHALFRTTEEAYYHYESEQHARNFNNFCPVCFTHGNCTIHKEFKQRITSVVDQYFIDQINEGNNSVAECLQIPEKTADKNDKDNSLDRTLNEDGKIHKLVENSININSGQKNAASQNTLPPENSIPKSANTKAVTSTSVKNSMPTNERLAESLQQSSERQLSDKVSNEFVKFNSLLQMIPPEDRLSCFMKFNKELTKMIECKQQEESTVVQPKEISDNTKCLNEIEKFVKILNHFFLLDSSQMQIPILIMYVRNLMQTVEVMLKTGLDIPIKQVFNFSEMNFPDRVVNLSDGLNITNLTLLDEVCRLRIFMQNQATFKSEQVTKLFHDFNAAIPVRLIQLRKNSRLFDDMFYGKATVKYKDNIRGSPDNLLFVDSDDDLLFESAVECSCQDLCNKTK